MKKTVNLKGTGMIHSYGMVQNLIRAIKVDDMDFFNKIFPGLFENYPDKDSLERAMRQGKVTVEPGEEEGDALITYEV